MEEDCFGIGVGEEKQEQEREGAYKRIIYILEITIFEFGFKCQCSLTSILVVLYPTAMHSGLKAELFSYPFLLLFMDHPTTTINDFEYSTMLTST